MSALHTLQRCGVASFSSPVVSMVRIPSISSPHKHLSRPVFSHSKWVSAQLWQKKMCWQGQKERLGLIFTLMCEIFFGVWRDTYIYTDILECFHHVCWTQSCCGGLAGRSYGRQQMSTQCIPQAWCCREATADCWLNLSWICIQYVLTKGCYLWASAWCYPV